MEYKTELTHSIFNIDTEKGMVEANKMVCTSEDRKALLQKIMDANPHLHFSWETADDYIGLFKNCYPDLALRVESSMISTLEMVNSGWTFSEANGYNPYWNYTKEQYDLYKSEMNKLYK